MIHNKISPKRGVDGRFHLFYVTINKVTQERYYGAHSTHNINDGYIGSGVYGDFSVESNKNNKHL